MGARTESKKVPAARLQPPGKIAETAFLAMLERDGLVLAHDLIRQNGTGGWNNGVLYQHVQRILGRILFVRFCDEHGAVAGAPLRKAPGQGTLFAGLMDHFRSLAPALCENTAPAYRDPVSVSVSDAFLKDFTSRLWAPEWCFIFSMGRAEMLGSIYERLLARLGSGKTGVKSGDRWLGRKATGIFYTPRHVVDYIVEKTVGQLISGKKPDQLNELKVLDPACGGGGFLIGTFDRICCEYLRWFSAHPRRQDERWCRKDARGELCLSAYLKRQIALRNIYGVDLDPQAIEVAALSLYVKILQDETHASIQAQRDLLHGVPLLPDLTRNLRCGNALIGTDYLDAVAEPDLEVRPFDWNTAFPDAFAKGGFDAVIGNPPYYNVDTLGKTSPQMKYLRRRYAEVWNDKTDILNYFLFRGLSLSKKKLGMIVSRAFLEAYKSNRLRDMLRRHTIEEIVDFGDHRVFGAGISTAILVVDTRSPVAGASVEVRQVSGRPEGSAVAESLLRGGRNGIFRTFQVKQSTLTAERWNLSPGSVRSVYDRIDESTVSLGKLFEIGQGMQTGCNEVFGGLTQAELERLGVGKQLSRKRAANSDIGRYSIRDRGQHLLWLEDVAEFEALPTRLKTFLYASRERLTGRAAYRRGDCEWWKFTWPLHRASYSQSKIVAPFLASSNRFALDRTRRFIGLTDTVVLFKRPEVKEDILYFLALLNSRLLDFRFKGIAKLKGAGVYEYFWNSVSRIPIRRVDFRNPAETAAHERLLRLARKMIHLTSRLQRASRDKQRQLLPHAIRVTDQQIDSVVYSLYRLTAAEIEIVQGAVRANATGPGASVR